MKRTKIFVVYENCCGIEILRAFWTKREANKYAEKAGELARHVARVDLPNT